MPETTEVVADKVPNKTAVKKAAAKKTAAPAVKKTTTPRKKPKAKRSAYQLDSGPISQPYSDVKAMLDDIALSAKPESTVTIWRESRTGKLKTKVRIG